MEFYSASDSAAIYISLHTGTKFMATWTSDSGPLMGTADTALFYPINWILQEKTLIKLLCLASLLHFLHARRITLIVHKIMVNSKTTISNILMPLP